jgi:large subunit ribosomal protein L25
MNKETINALVRDLAGEQPSLLRRNGKLPVILYGKDVKPQALIVDRKEFSNTFSKTGFTTLLLLKLNSGEPINVLVHDIQRHPVTDELLHADFFRVTMTEKIKTELPLEIVGLAPAVEELEGNLLTPRTEIEVECLPDALVPKIEVDATTLKTFDDVIHVRDLTIPEGITVLTDPDEIVAQVTPPRSTEELEAELAEPVGEAAEKEAVEKLSEESTAEAGVEKTEEGGAAAEQTATTKEEK